MVKNLPAIRQHGDDSIALALGGGASRGLAHILILEALDEVGVRPTMLAGTSMGAIIGSLYCAGMTGAEIREFATELFKSRGRLIRRVVGKWPNSITDLWNPRTPALFNAETLFGIVMPEQLPDTFEELDTPIRIVATDFYSQEQVMIDSGPLLPAICASSSLPILFEPVRHNDRILIDGGFVNPTPFDVITDAARYTVAVDVNGEPQGETGEAPGSMDCLLGAFFITLRTILNHKLEIMTPDILVSPDVGGFRALRFYQIEEILAASEPAKDTFKRDLDKLLNRAPVDA